MTERKNLPPQQSESKPVDKRHFRDRLLDGIEGVSNKYDNLIFRMDRSLRHHPEQWLGPIVIVGAGAIAYYLVPELISSQVKQSLSTPFQP